MKVPITLLAAALLLTLGFRSVHAQDHTPLRPSYQGAFLPEGTRIVVLIREAREERSGRLQPEFMARDEYPRHAELVHRRDVLGDGGFSSQHYERTDRSGTVYFLYALTPDSTLYWSYSAQRDSLKFDVVNTGVMSVAPILTWDVQEDVLHRFYRQRVVVHMPNRNDDAEKTDPAAVEATETGEVAGQDALVERPDSTARLTETPASVPPVAAASPPASRRAASSNSTGPISLPVVLVVGLVAMGSLYYARKYRGEVKRLRRRLIAVREEDLVQHASKTLRRELDEMRGAHDVLRRKYAALQARCAELETELERDRPTPPERTA